MSHSVPQVSYKGLRRVFSCMYPPKASAATVCGLPCGLQSNGIHAVWHEPGDTGHSPPLIRGLSDVSPNTFKALRKSEKYEQVSCQSP